MLRYRELYQKGTEVILKTVFTPSPSDDMSLETFAVSISWNPKRKELLRISKAKLPDSGLYLPFPAPPTFYPLPELEQIQEEVNYLFNLILTLKPYEIKTQTVPEDFPALPH